MWRKIIFVLLWLVCQPVYAQTHQHATATIGDGQFNPFVTADRRGGFYLAYVERANNTSNLMLRHTNNGVNFSAPVRVNDRAGEATVRNENPPKVLVGPQGDVYVCWADEREKWKGNLRFARSTNGGKSFSPSITLNSDAALTPAGHAFQSLAVDRQGRIYVAWIDERNKRKEDRGAEIWLAISTDRGKTFSRDRPILTDVCECCRTNLQIDAAGNLYLAYRTVPRSGPMYRDIIVARSLDGGKTFAPVVVSQDKWEINGCPIAGPSLSVDEGGQLTVVWFMGGAEKPGLYYATSTDRGGSFTARRWLSNEQRLGKHAHTAVTRGSRVFVVWDDAAEQQTVSVWGLLDQQAPALRPAGRQMGASYPVVAVNDRFALIVALQPGKRDIFTQVVSLNVIN